MYSIYDEHDTLIKGGFPTREDAWSWFVDHRPIVLVSMEDSLEVGRVPTNYEADCVRAAHPDIGTRAAAENEYRVLFDGDKADGNTSINA